LRRALIRAGSFWRELRVLPVTASTNAVLAAEAADAPEGLIVVAEHQTAGRGRLDRSWISPPRAGLTFSVLLRPQQVADRRWTWLPLLVGLATAEGIEQTTGIEVTLKWPNDLLVADRKLGGVLVERHGDAVIAGVGFNVTTRLAELASAEATSLVAVDAVVTDRETLLRTSLRALAHRYLRWTAARGDASTVAPAYTERCGTLGSLVRVQLPDGSVLAGRAQRVDDLGRLVLVTDDGEQTVSSGDVVHVRST
jgi:BirA family transcriptional regulator, biotin operon repressor / biotin---[acetyl-CoA-carboxylase] ligase